MISSLLGKASRTLVDIVRLAKRGILFKAPLCVSSNMIFYRDGRIENIFIVLKVFFCGEDSETVWPNWEIPKESAKTA